jgi:c(7)-type cytochrome triheme protein
MRHHPFLLAVVCLAVFSSACQHAAEQQTAAAPVVQAPAAPPGDPNNPPETILIASAYGNVTFTHKKHFDRVGGDCTTCHTKIFPMAREPLNYKKANHRAAEASYTSCASCHAVGRTSFAADSNCTKCHAPKDYSRR